MRNNTLYYSKRKSSEKVSDLYALIKIVLLATVALLFFTVDQIRASGLETASTEPRFELTGVVLDQASGEPIFGAAILLSGSSRGATTDFNGRFELRSLREGDYELRISSMGYETTLFSITVPSEEREFRLAPSRFQLDDIIVTATPTRSAVNYQSSQAFTERDIERSAGVALGEMLDGEPGLSARSFGGGPSRPVIRGYDGERLIVLENGERMGDIQQTAPDHAITLDPFGMSRVEVVRGPASLLYGSSALGGVVNLFTDDFARSWNRGLQGGLTSHGASNNEMIGLGAGLIYGTNRFSYTGRLIYRTSGDSSTPNGTLPNTYVDSYTLSGGVGLQTSRFTGGLSARYYENNFGIPEFAAEVDPSNPDRFIELEPDMEIRINRWNLQAAGNLRMDGFFDELDFRLSASHSTQEEGEPGIPFELLELEIKTATISSTAMLLHKPFLMFDRGVIGSNLHVRYQEVEGIEAYHPGEDIVNLSLFTFQEIPVTNRFRMQLGGRIEHEWLSSVSNRYFASNPNPIVVDTDIVTPFDGITERVFNIAASAGLNIRPTDWLELGTQFARAHRNPTIVERYADGWHAGATRIEIGDPTLKPEIGYGVDAFIRLTGTRARIESSLFYNRIDNFVALRTLPANCGDAINDYRVIPDREFARCVQFFGADADMRGFEMSGSLFITDHLRMNVMADYVRGDRRDVDQPLPFIPPFRTSLGFLYDNNSINLGAHARFVSAQNRTPEDELDTDAYAIVRMEAGYRFMSGGVHSIHLRIDNLLNTSYRDHMSVVRRFDDPVLGPEGERRFDMPGRNINLSYRYTF